MDLEPATRRYRSWCRSAVAWTGCPWRSDGLRGCVPLSLADLNDRLDQRFRLLTGGSRSAMPRQQTLRATVEWSYSLLNEPEQSVLRRLSVFVEGFDLDAAEAVCSLGDIDEFEVTDLLGSLVDKSLVVAEPGGLGTVRYRLLETIRQFSAERLVERDELEAADVSTAHCSYFLSLARQAEPYLTGPEQGRWLARLVTEQANLRRAIEHAVAEPDGTARALERDVAEPVLVEIRSRRDEATSLLWYTRHPEAQASPGYCPARSVVGAFHDFVGPDKAQRSAEQAVEIARSLGDERLLARSLGVQAAVCYFSGRPEVGLPYGEEALARAPSSATTSFSEKLCSCTSCPGKRSTRPLPGQLYAEERWPALASPRRPVHRLRPAQQRRLYGPRLERCRRGPSAPPVPERQIAREISFERPPAWMLALGWVSWEEGDPDSGLLFK